MNRRFPHIWICTKFEDHLQNAIDRAFPTGKIPSWSLAQKWDAIYDDAENEQNNCEERNHG